ncbi:MAG: glycerol-3-phosphate dehydrogenase/oxidase [Alicyclobacillus sp.]|nr:glycerol-3-phosphate dehydrogenase/oxidase [Alicyclobacillus sp.]
MQDSKLDLLIIGGGITGAGILLDATTRGLRAALIEMQDFAAGTSSRSTKLVHGGLRYLKQFEIGLVAEVGKERAIVHRNGPHVTHPEWMLLPIYRGGTYGRLAASFGIRLYDYLAGVQRSERRTMLTKQETLRREPLLRQDGLLGSACYVEYRTDDARLTIEVLKEAVARGGLALNYVRCDRLLYQGGKVAGVAATDILAGAESELRAHVVVNATGPWVDEIRELDGSKSGKQLHHTKGVHIVVDGRRFPLQNPVYFDVPDGRMVFAIPRDGKTYIGTTDTDYHGDLAHPDISPADQRYLTDAVNHVFPTVQLRIEDIESGWAGIRPLIHEAGKSPSEISRKEEIFVSPSGLITMAGGKLTGYRKMAEKAVDLCCRRLSEMTGRTYPPCATAHVPISGGHYANPADYEASVEAAVRDAKRVGLPDSDARLLASRYGTNAGHLLERILTRPTDDAAASLPPAVFAQLAYAIEAEMACTPLDFFQRRTGALLFDIDLVRRTKTAVVQYFAEQFRWSEAERAARGRELDDAITAASGREPGSMPDAVAAGDMPMHTEASANGVIPTSPSTRETVK